MVIYDNIPPSPIVIIKAPIWEFPKAGDPNIVP